VGLNLVTIGITAFNAADSVGKAIESALSQDWPEIEIIVVDDASTDETGTILAQFQEKYQPRLAVYTLPYNQGVAAARNAIIAHANGNFLAFFDDDDTSVPSRIRVQHDQIIAVEERLGHKGRVISHAARLQVGGQGQDRYVPALGSDDVFQMPHGPDVARWILTGHPVIAGRGAGATCSQMARLQTYRDMGGFDPALRRSEDTDFNIRLSMAGGIFAAIRMALVRQIITTGVEKTKDAEDSEFKKVIIKHRDFIEQTMPHAFCLAWVDLKRSAQDRQYIKGLYRLIKIFIIYPVPTSRRLVAYILAAVGPS
jgi:glycosyltransferase involved in cell wall biosynthesis